MFFMPTIDLDSTRGHKRHAHPTGLIIPFPLRVYREVTGDWEGLGIYQRRTAMGETYIHELTNPAFRTRFFFEQKGG